MHCPSWWLPPCLPPNPPSLSPRFFLLPWLFITTITAIDLHKVYKYPTTLGQEYAPVIPALGMQRHDMQIPGACWPVGLAKSASSRFSVRTCPPKIKWEQFWLLHWSLRFTCTCVYLNLNTHICTHTFMLIYASPREKQWKKTRKFPLLQKRRIQKILFPGSIWSNILRDEMRPGCCRRNVEGEYDKI